MPFPAGIGIVDLMLDIPDDDKVGQYDFLKPLLRFTWVASRWLIANGRPRPFDVIHVHNIPDFLVFATWHAKLRGSKIYAEIIGYGLSGDAHHITAPSETGDGAVRAMKGALKRAKLNPEDIDYINAHGTSTPLGDEIELNAVKRVFGEAAYKLSMSSTKSAIGHLLGAAGSVEAIFCILAIRDSVCPPTLNLDNPSPGCDLDLVAKQAKPRKIRAALSNSFGFGGTNASLVFTGAP